jgi:hypothetical protein
VSRTGNALSNGAFEEQALPVPYQFTLKEKGREGDGDPGLLFKWERILY